ncbi:MAG TPA: TetR/AcrR family transcriptional regulator [Candidatus Sulfotelmatobacter sp.]|nr:TetR/AcrR family transcriptional regulator [Candidatus Sulfotelmatobacter sp.]
MKTEPPAARTALLPQRQHGKRRVASLLAAAAAVFEERGFEAATMAEVAARADAPIGSLYRFFPNKEALGDALLQRYAERMAQAFANLDAAERKSLAAFSDGLLEVMADLHGEKLAILPLLDTYASAPSRRAELYGSILRLIVDVLRRRKPQLSPGAAADMAVVLVQNMKSMKSLRTETDGTDNAGAIAELQAMTRLYLASKLGEPGG